VQQQRHTQADRIALGHGLAGTEARRRKFSTSQAMTQSVSLRKPEGKGSVIGLA
jgi:hypothetical protein